MKWCVYKILREKKILYKMIWTNVTMTNVALTIVPNISYHLLFVNLGCMPNFSLLGYVEVRKKDVLWGGGRLVGGFGSRIMPRCGSILQAGTCLILSLAEVQDGAECGNTIFSLYSRILTFNDCYILLYFPNGLLMTA